MPPPNGNANQRSKAGQIPKGTASTLEKVCQGHLLHTKWLMAPSHRVGHQWIEALGRSGQSVVNLNPTTVLRLALDIVGFELRAGAIIAL